MNRILLIGNGFDMAHNMPTSYRHFLDDFWEQTIKEIHKTKPNNKFENEDIIIEIVPSNWYPGFTYENLIKSVKKPLDNGIVFKNSFLEVITTKYFENWVDIENEYYTLLKQSYKVPSSKWEISKLNAEFKRIENHLIAYLSKIEDSFSKNIEDDLIYNIGNKIYSEFKLKDFTEQSISKKAKEEYQKISNDISSLKNGDISMIRLDPRRQLLLSVLNLKKPLESIKELLLSNNATKHFELIPDHTLFLNFNYTSTEYAYNKVNKFENNNYITEKKNKIGIYSYTRET